MREVFHALNERLAGAVSGGFCSADGLKFLVSNARFRNLIVHNFDDGISWLGGHMAGCLRRFNEIDALEEWLAAQKAGPSG